MSGSARLSAWLAEQRISLAFTTYQTGKLFLLGRHPDGRLAVNERTFNRAMGLWADGQTIWLSTRYQLWRLENLLRPDELYQGCDRLYVPKVANTTGDLDIHDVAVDPTGRPVFVATSFGCLATLADRASFTPLWRPPFLSKLAAEDRCHLNGLALADGRPRYVTAVSTSDVVDGWRDRRHDGGVVLEDTRRPRDRLGPVDAPLARASIAAGSGCTIPAPATSAASTPAAARSSRSSSARATSAAWPSPAILPSSGSRRHATTKPSPASPSRKSSPNATRSPAAA